MPKALDAGFSGTRAHISNTGGAAHLRDMIANAEARSEARDVAMQSALVKQLKGEYGTLQGLLDRESRLRRVGAWQRGRQIALGAGAVLLAFKYPPSCFRTPRGHDR